MTGVARGVGRARALVRARGLMRALGEVGELLLPARCVGCSGRLSVGAGALVCTACAGRLAEPPWPRCPRCHMPRGTGRRPEPDCLACRDWPAVLTAARWAAALAPPADALVHGLKYEGWRRLAPFMAARMAGVTLLAPTAPRVVVPIPTTRKRERERGYNQAALLAGAFAERRELELVSGLERREGGRSQVSLHPAERRANVHDAFRMRPSGAGSVAGAEVILVDDVLTTGATACAAAATLERAGARGVVVVTFARSLPGRLDGAGAAS